MANMFDSGLIHAALGTKRFGFSDRTKDCSKRAIIGVSRDTRGSNTAALVHVFAYENGHFEIIDIKSGEWNHDIMRDQVLVAQRHHDSAVFLETNAALQYFVTVLQRESKNIYGVVSQKRFIDEWLQHLAKLFAYRGIGLPNVDGIPDSIECLRLVHELVGYKEGTSIPLRIEALLFAIEGAKLLVKKEIGEEWSDAIAQNRDATVQLDPASTGSAAVTGAGLEAASEAATPENAEPATEPELPSDVIPTADGKHYSVIKCDAMASPELMEVNLADCLEHDKVFAALEAIQQILGTIDKLTKNNQTFSSLQRLASTVYRYKSDAKRLAAANEQLAMRIRFQEENGHVASVFGIPMELWQDRWSGIVNGPHVWIMESVPGIANPLEAVLNQKPSNPSYVRYSRNPESLDRPEQEPVFVRNGTNGLPIQAGDDLPKCGEFQQPTPQSGSHPG